MEQHETFATAAASSRFTEDLRTDNMPRQAKLVELIWAKNGRFTSISVTFCRRTTTLNVAVVTTHCSKLTLIHFAHDEKKVTLSKLCSEVEFIM